ncbi:MAG TPA: hypothetical protein VLA93_07590 [Pyrinomonadaceae bacterium]|nr:hypothetical protein [Pyrinomonadaceae bacterium]
MKTVARILLIGCVAAALYFGTIGRNDFYRLVDSIYDAIQIIAANFTKK